MQLSDLAAYSLAAYWLEKQHSCAKCMYFSFRLFTVVVYDDVSSAACHHMEMAQL